MSSWHPQNCGVHTGMARRVARESGCVQDAALSVRAQTVRIPHPAPHPTFHTLMSSRILTTSGATKYTLMPLYIVSSMHSERTVRPLARSPTMPEQERQGCVGGERGTAFAACTVSTLHRLHDEGIVLTMKASF